MGRLLAMTEAQLAVTVHAAKSKSLGRCDQRRHCPPHPPPPQPQIDKLDYIQKMDITRDSRAAGNQRRGQFSASRFTADGSVRANAPQQGLTTERQRCSPQQHVSSGKCDGGHFYVAVSMRLTTAHLNTLLQRTHMNHN